MSKFPATSERLIADVRVLIETARGRVAQAINSSLVILHWHVGRRIREDILGQERAAHGKRIIATLSRQLTREYGRGFSRDALFRMVQFAERFPHEEIVATLSRQLGWSHFVELIAIDADLAREFYAEMCRLEGAR